MTTHKEQIKSYLFGKGWVIGAEIKRYFANEYISDADRRCREMVNEGILESKIENGKVYYRSTDIVSKFKSLRPKEVENNQMELI